MLEGLSKPIVGLCAIIVLLSIIVVPIYNEIAKNENS
jgi:hypothetical protein